MPKKSNSALFDLIKSMTPTEKRYFNLNHATNTDKVYGYVFLFSLIEKMKIYDEDKLKKQLEKEKKETKNLGFRKNHLYKLLLESLSKLYRNSGSEEEVVTLIQQTKILLDKRLFSQAEKLIRKADKICEKYDLIEYQILLMKWRKIMMLHMENSGVSEMLSLELENNEIQHLIQRESEVFEQLSLDSSVWVSVIEIANAVRLENKNGEKWIGVREKIVDNLKDSALSFISEIRYYHSIIMIDYLLDQSSKSPPFIKACFNRWDERPHMKKTYFRNYIVSLNLRLISHINSNELIEAKVHLKALFHFVNSKENEISFANKVKVYSFYYVNYLTVLLKEEAYDLIVQSFKKEKVNAYFNEFELVKKSQVYLRLTVAYYFLDFDKEIKELVSFSYYNVKAHQKNSWSEIRIIYYLKLYKKGQINQLKRLMRSSDRLVKKNILPGSNEWKVINLLTQELSEEEINRRLKLVLIEIKTINNRPYINQLIDSIETKNHGNL